MKFTWCVVVLLLVNVVYGRAQPTAQLIDSASRYKYTDYAKAISFSGEAYKKAIAAGQERMAGKSAAILGAGNYLAGKYEDALRWYFESERLYGRTADTAGLAGLYADMCILYIKIKKFDAAHAVIGKAVRYATTTGDAAALATAINNRGLLYMDEQRTDSAVADFSTSYRIYKTRNDKRGMAYSLDYLASALSEKRQYTAALDAMNEGRTLRAGTGDQTGQAIATNNIGELQLKMKQPAAAVISFKAAMALAHELGFKDLEVYTYGQLALAYRQLNDYKNAYEAQEQYLQLNQKLLDEKNTKNLEELSARYEANKKEQQNKLLTQQNVAQRVKLQRDEIGIYALVTLSLLGVVVFYLLYSRYRANQQARFREAMHTAQKQRAQGMIDAEENERQRLARELHDGVGQLLSAARRKIETTQTMSAMDENSALKMLDESIKEVRDLSHSMMPPAVVNRGLRQAIEEYMNRIRAGWPITIHCEWVNLEHMALDKTTTLMLYRSVQEIMGNILKHAHATRADLELVQHDTEITLMIYDNGIGFDKAAVAARGNGLGLKNIASRIAYAGGTVEIDTSPGNGVTYIIEIPLQNGQ